MITYRRHDIGRLTGETRTGTNAFSASYTVDGAGNRTSQTINGSTSNFTLNIDDELTASSGGFANSYSYNANGEQTGRTLAGTAYSLSFDYDGQLTQITQGGNTTSFAYDALGRRYSRTAGGTTTQFYYAGSAVLLEKQGGTTTGVYSYGNGLLRRGGEYPLFDGSGSERTVTNSGQSVTGSINFEAFGQTAGSSGSSSSPYMFAGNWGYRTDGDAGLMKVGARYYDAQVGRFITRDIYLDLHPYLYCEHEPVGFVDPSGRGAIAELAVAAALEYLSRYDTHIPDDWKWAAGMIGGAWQDYITDPIPMPKSLGAMDTFAGGADALGHGLRVVIGYRKRIDTYLDPDGDWEGEDARWAGFAGAKW